MEMGISRLCSVICIVAVKVACCSVEEEAEVQAIILVQDWRGILWQFDVMVCRCARIQVELKWTYEESQT